MEIFRILNDGFRYRELDLYIDDIIDIFPVEMDDVAIHDFSKHNLAIRPYWKTIKTGFSEIDGNENLYPDITYWIDATLLLSPKAHRFLSDVLLNDGEFLHITIDDETYYLFNCLSLATITEDDDDSSAFTVDFDSFGDQTVVKSVEQYCADIFCSRIIKSAVEKYGLKGIVFEKI